MTAYYTPCCTSECCTTKVHAKYRRPVHIAPALFVELGGFEPPTLSMPWRCATSCAIAPSEAIRFMGVEIPTMNQRRNHHIMQPDGFIVELGGFEPPTLSMPWRCATSCAIAPFSIVSPFLNLVYITTGSCILQIGVSPNDIGVIWRHHNHRLFRSTFPFPLVGIGDGWTVVIVHEPPTNRVIRLIHGNQTHPVCIAHGYHRRKSGIDCGDA